MKRFIRYLKCKALGHKYGKPSPFLLGMEIVMCRRCHEVMILTKDQSQDTRPSNYDPR